MNYITHLNGFMQRAYGDLRLNPSHISLYLALFQQWNLNRFRNPISIARGEVMQQSKIHSRVTYHKCIKELHSWGYFHYDPSYNHFRGSLVYMTAFGGGKEQEKASVPAQDIFCTGAGPEADGGCTGTEQEMSPSLNKLNGLNIRNRLNGGAHAASTASEQEGNRKVPGKEKGCAEKEKRKPPCLAEVQAFFAASGASELEAQRFFHYYSATGWVMGQAPIRDWQAAGRKWLLHDLVYQPGPGATPSGELAAALARDYDEPL